MFCLMQRKVVLNCLLSAFFESVSKRHWHGGGGGQPLASACPAVSSASDSSASVASPYTSAQMSASGHTCHISGGGRGGGGGGGGGGGLEGLEPPQ